MNYIEQIRKFWQCNNERPIGCNATALYFYLLNINNSLGWKDTFRHSDRYISLQLGIAINTVRSSKNLLAQLGLLHFKAPSKKSRGLDGSTLYSFITVLTNDTLTDMVIDTDADMVIDTVTDTDINTVPDTRDKLNKTKLNNNVPPLVPPGKKTATNEINIPKSESIQPEFKKEKSCAKKESVALQFPYSSDRFMLAWQTLIESPKWRKKIHYTLQLALDKLARFEEEFAIMLVESAAANDWQGIIFPDTGEKYLKWKSSQKTKTSNFANYDNNRHYEQF